MDLDHLRRRARGTLRVVACGSAGVGKGTLIGRLLREAEASRDDELPALAPESSRSGTRGGAPDPALLLEGLRAEWERAIAGDVAFRSFSTAKRRFVVADVAGHGRATCSTIAGAATADAAVILVDAREGVTTQARRQAHLVSLVGVRRIVLAVNKLDLLGFSREAFDRIKAQFTAFAGKLGLDAVTLVPLSALTGDNVATRSANMPWHHGPTLLECLETVDADDADSHARPFRMPVQRVSRPGADFRGLAGRVAGGSIRPGDRIRVLPSGRESVVARIVTGDGDRDRAVAGQWVVIALEDEVGIGPGDLLAQADSPAAIADHFQATVVWMDEQEMLPGRSYLLRAGGRTVGASLARPKYTVDVDTLQHLAARTLRVDDVGVCELNLDERIPFDPHAQNRTTGGFVLIDRLTRATIGAGLLQFALRRSDNVHWQATQVDKEARARLNGQRPCVVWFTGLSGAGKSTIANALETKLHALGRHTCLLDGDNVRHGLCKDLGFTAADRVENVRRVAEVAALMVQAGLIVLVAFISPFRAERRMARALVDAGEFCEVFVDTPLEHAERRDAKGLYAKARRGELKNFTGVDSPYEPPENAEVTIDTVATTPDAAADIVIERLRRAGVLDAAQLSR